MSRLVRKLSDPCGRRDIWTDVQMRAGDVRHAIGRWTIDPPLDAFHALRTRRAHARHCDLGARIVCDHVPGLPGYTAVRRAWPIRLWRRLLGRPVTDAGDILAALHLPKDY